MRITKEYDERRQEIIDKSSKQFNRKGYGKTSVADIVKDVAIAKGTFYYYFKTKEEVLDAIIDQKIDDIVSESIKIANDPTIDVKRKLFLIILGGNNEAKEQDKIMDDEKLKEVLHLKDHEKFHLKSIVVSIRRLAPILSQVIEEGIDQGIFKTDYPLETIEVLLASSSMLFDDGIFKWEPKEATIKIKAFLHIMEKSLGAETGSLTYLSDAIQYGL